MPKVSGGRPGCPSSNLVHDVNRAVGLASKDDGHEVKPLHCVDFNAFLNQVFESKANGTNIVMCK